MHFFKLLLQETQKTIAAVNDEHLNEFNGCFMAAWATISNIQDLAASMDLRLLKNKTDGG